MNEGKKKFDEAQKIYETYNKNDYTLAVSNRDLSKRNYLSAKDTAQEDIVSELEKQIQELEANQKALKDANDKKKGLESKLENANRELKQAQDDLIEQQKEYESLEYIKLDRDKSTFKSHRDFSSEKEITFKHS